MNGGIVWWFKVDKQQNERKNTAKLSRGRENTHRWQTRIDSKARDSPNRRDNYEMARQRVTASPPSTSAVPKTCTRVICSPSQSAATIIATIGVRLL